MLVCFNVSAFLSTLQFIFLTKQLKLADKFCEIQLTALFPSVSALANA